MKQKKQEKRKGVEKERNNKQNMSHEYTKIKTKKSNSAIKERNNESKNCLSSNCATTTTQNYTKENISAPIRNTK